MESGQGSDEFNGNINRAPILFLSEADAGMDASSHARSEDMKTERGAGMSMGAEQQYNSLHKIHVSVSPELDN